MNDAKVTVLLYDQFKDGMIYHKTMTTKFGRYAIDTIARDIELPGLTLWNRGYETFAIRTADIKKTVIADLVQMPLNAWLYLEERMKNRDMMIDHFNVDGDICLIFLKDHLTLKDEIILTGKCKDFTVSDKETSTNSSVGKSSCRVYRSMEEFAKRRVSGPGGDWNRHSDF